MEEMMLIYEHSRTQDIVKRMTMAGSLVRSLVILSWIIVLAGLFIVPTAIISPDYWWLGGILGGLAGLILGTINASILNLLLEWMAQMLVAQGEIVAATKNRS